MNHRSATTASTHVEPCRDEASDEAGAWLFGATGSEGRGLGDPVAGEQQASADVDSQAATKIYREAAFDLDRATDDVAQKWMADIVRRGDHLPNHVVRLLEQRLRLCQSEISAAILRFRSAGRAQEWERVALVRSVLRMPLNVAASFLLQLVDYPNRPHWGAGLDASPDGVDRDLRRRTAVYAANIRNALRAHGLAEALETVPGRGYQISSCDALEIRALWGETL